MTKLDCGRQDETRAEFGRRILFCAVILLLGPAGQAMADDALTTPQQQRAIRLYTKFVAPCCWLQSVAVHQSPQAAEVRNEIDRFVAAGQSDDDIKNTLIRQYGHGILMEPEGWRADMVYTGPWLVLLTGLFAVVRWICFHRTNVICETGAKGSSDERSKQST